MSSKSLKKLKRNAKEGDVFISIYEHDSVPRIHIIFEPGTTLILPMDNWVQVLSILQFLASEEKKGNNCVWSKEFAGEYNDLFITYMDLGEEEVVHLKIELCLGDFHTYLFFKGEHIAQLESVAQQLATWLEKKLKKAGIATDYINEADGSPCGE
ncbi:hypothetical protein SAMN02745181_0530 [Rubritalea squalenifaciens DSM 18772]|uniref:Uncharacterized protein n=1 Tax=Rubritalea squalenifaciens DSM 18772 TaxID=1123071 RepID=A0A1M6CNW5_9BACT|nr:hypothetical protein [Rubritalea squalenifaciens]SHI62745.1 hypothetical protein SAMN02745181_0530 [Rubritalea squalenifaciens DSM 18772]